MPQRSAIGTHPRRQLIEMLITARVPTRFLASRFGISRAAASRYKLKFEKEERQYVASLRRSLREGGITKKTLMRDYANV